MTMTIQEFIQILQALEPTLPVYVYDPDGADDYNFPDPIIVERVSGEKCVVL